MKIFKNLGAGFLILALGVGSGEFIIWPYLTVNYGFGILWGVVLGITLQLFLINIISRNTLIFKENIILSFAKVFSWTYIWIIFSTIIGFGWPGFSSLASKLIVDGFGINESLFLPFSILILIMSGMILIFSKNSYKKILNLEKVLMTFLFLLSFFLFLFYFDMESFKELILGFFGIGKDYIFFPDGFKDIAFLTVFLGGIAYAGSGGNLLLANSFYVLKDGKKKIKSIFKNNFLFFWLGGILIIAMLSYISHVVLSGTNNISDDFSFLILESKIFSENISVFVGKFFILLGAAAIMGVQIGILDFIGRISTVAGKNMSINKKIPERKFYIFSIILTIVFGLIIFALGMEKPKSLIIIGAVINAFSMGAIALLLLLLEIKKVPKKIKSKKIILGLIVSSLFYFSFFLYIFFEKFIF